MDSIINVVKITDKTIMDLIRGGDSERENAGYSVEVACENYLKDTCSNPWVSNSSLEMSENHLRYISAAFIEGARDGRYVDPLR